MAVTGSSTFNIASAGAAGLVGPAYDRYVEFALRSQPLLRSLADKRPVQMASPGSSVVFNIHQDMAQATSALTDGTDVTAVALSNTTNVTVTLNEYGNVVTTTRKLDAFSLSDVDPAVANIIAFNMADSLDSVVAAVLTAGITNVTRGGARTSTATVASTDVITGAMVRRAATGLRTNNAVPRWGLLYGAYIHPEVAYDLRAEAGTGNFEDIRKYSDDTVGNILTGVTGIVHGCYFIETPRVTVDTTGSASTRVFRTYIVGQQALAEAAAIEPHVVVGPVVDSLLRNRPVGWYGLLGWSAYRTASSWKFETTSSIHTT